MGDPPINEKNFNVQNCFIGHLEPKKDSILVDLGTFYKKMIFCPLKSWKNVDIFSKIP